MYSGIVIDGPYKGKWINSVSPVWQCFEQINFPVTILDDKIPVTDGPKIITYHFNTKTREWSITNEHL